MYGSEKVKSFTGIAGLIPAITLLAVMIFTIILFGESAGFKVAGSGVLIYALVILNFFLKTRSIGYLSSFLYVTSLGIFVVSFPVEYMNT